MLRGQATCGKHQQRMTIDQKNSFITNSACGTTDDRSLTSLAEKYNVIFYTDSYHTREGGREQAVEKSDAMFHEAIVSINIATTAAQTSIPVARLKPSTSG